MKLCQCGCNQEIPLINKKGKPQNFKHGHNRRGLISNYKNYKGGKKTYTNGYILILKKDHPKANNQGYVLEHRLVWEEHHNCCLLPLIHLHHKNGKPWDNRIENLEPLTARQHISLHHPKIDKSGRFCIICKSKTTWIDKRGYEYWTHTFGGFICNRCHARKK